MSDISQGDVLGIIHDALRKVRLEDHRVQQVNRLHYRIAPYRNADSCNNAEVILTTSNGEKNQYFMISLLGVKELSPRNAMKILSKEVIK